MEEDEQKRNEMLNCGLSLFDENPQTSPLSVGTLADDCMTNSLVEASMVNWKQSTNSCNVEENVGSSLAAMEPSKSKEKECRISLKSSSIPETSESCNTMEFESSNTADSLLQEPVDSRQCTPKKRMIERYVSDQIGGLLTPSKDSSIEFFSGNTEHIVFVGVSGQCTWSSKKLKTCFFINPELKKRLTFRCESNPTIAQLKNEMLKRWGLNNLILTFKGQEVENKLEIGDSQFDEGAAFICFGASIDERYFFKGGHSGNH